MAHKARRRPSWKKTRSKHFLTKWQRKQNYSQRYHKFRKLRREVFQELDRIVQDEIDREILKKLSLTLKYGA